MIQLGVCLVAYNGNQGTWAHRLYRRDLRSRLQDPVEEVLTLLQRREKARRPGNWRGSMSELARRGVMIYAARAILKDKSTALWRMDMEAPVPYELVTGLWFSQADRIRVSLDLISWYADYKRFVFVPKRATQATLVINRERTQSVGVRHTPNSAPT